MLCHPISHDVIRCIQECMKPRPPGCAHKCKKGCWEDCGPCTVQTKKVRSLCGHTIRTECHVDANDEKCSEPCGYPMICGHSCLDQCSPAGHDALRHRCKEPCNRTPLCGHPCLNKCSEQCGKAQIFKCLQYVFHALKLNRALTL